MGTVFDLETAREGGPASEGASQGGEPGGRAWPASAVLAGCDLLAASLGAVAVGVVATAVAADPGDVIPPWYLAAATVMLPAVGFAYGLYTTREQGDHSGVDDLPRIAHAALATAWALVIVDRVVHSSTEALPLFFAVLGVFAAAAVVRIPIRLLARARLIRPQLALIVGTGNVGAMVAQKLRRHPEYGIRVAGFLDVAPPVSDTPDVVSGPVLGHVDDVAEIARRVGASRLIVAFSLAHHDQTLSAIGAARRAGLAIDIVPRLFESVGPRADVYTIEGLQLMALARPPHPRMHVHLKRAVDVIAATAALILFAPVIAAIAIWIRLDSPGPVFYRHDRLTVGGRTFRLFKFRTMHVQYCRGDDYGGAAAEAAHAELMARDDLRHAFESTHKLPGDPRITRAGRALRSRSLDELPQLFNVLKGDLSLVGPRPITAEELPRYGSHGHRLMSVRPGVTGYWQTNGRSRVTFDERVRLDMAYIESQSLRLDLRIIAQTLPTLVGDRGAY
jgi:exopolysaccharide biosynthesis polyprenyl glycosylphosphotransferase